MLPAPLSEKQSGLQAQLESTPGPGNLFGVALTKVPTPMERLRGDLREVLARRRGAQSRLADALRISRHTLSNAINGRERFSPTAAAALRRWLDGNPISEAWPPLPPGEEDAA
jgi:plasmid maintenance system antidote protein VapI